MLADRVAAVLDDAGVGFQREGERLITVVESLVKPKDGPPTLVYQLQSPDLPPQRLLRKRPRIDIPPPPAAGY